MTIQRKKKTCKNGCEDVYIFAHGLCQRCYGVEQAKKAREKASNAPCNRRSLKSNTKYPPRGKTVLKRPKTKFNETEYWGFGSQVELFNYLWRSEPHVCRFTDEKLDKYYGTKKWVNCFAHIIPKGKYPYFKLNSDNVVLVSPDFHYVVDHGSTDDRARHPEWRFDLWDSIVEAMKEKYEQFLEDNML